MHPWRRGLECARDAVTGDSSQYQAVVRQFRRVFGIGEVHHGTWLCMRSCVQHGDPAETFRDDAADEVPEKSPPGLGCGSQAGWR